MSPRWKLAASGVLCAALAACGSGASEGTDWMADIADTRGLAELSIPGTHDAGALHEVYAGLTKCQNLTIADQLAAGVRFFDIRCRHINDAFLIFHGAFDQDQTYDEVLATMFAFLDEHPSETLIISVMEESLPSGVTRSFEATFASYVDQARDRWHLDPVLPQLGDVRGKLVLLRRFPAVSTPLGVDGSVWADNATFSISNDASLRVQDDYIVTDNELKWTAITGMLGEAGGSSAPTLFLNFTSGYQTIGGLSNVPSVSDDINPRLDAFFADPQNRHAHTGVMVMDFVTAARVQAIISTNMP
jgi:1-phosphatidylinositol phosphodiesterase